ncbi:MAG: TerB family tellurite resistance protein [Thermosynechococcaceae cyanobacterium]
MDLAHQKLMLKILIGSAWADRHVEPEEVAYLGNVLLRFHLDHDAELQALLRSPVPIEQTELWLIDYLKDASDTERLKLLAAIGNLLMSDHVVSSIEHDLLDEFHDLMNRIPPTPEPESPHYVSAIAPTLAQRVGQFFRRVMEIAHQATHTAHSGH